jgi:hypothetical protein
MLEAAVVELGRLTVAHQILVVEALAVEAQVLAGMVRLIQVAEAEVVQGLTHHFHRAVLAVLADQE